MTSASITNLRWVRFASPGALAIPPLASTEASAQDLTRAISRHLDQHLRGPIRVEVRPDLIGGHLYRQSGEDLGAFHVEQVRLTDDDPHQSYLIDFKQCPGGECMHADCIDLGGFGCTDTDRPRALAGACSAALPGVLVRLYAVDEVTTSPVAELAAFFNGAPLP